MPEQCKCRKKWKWKAQTSQNARPEIRNVPLELLNCIQNISLRAVLKGIHYSVHCSEMNALHADIVDAVKKRQLNDTGWSADDWEIVRPPKRRRSISSERSSSSSSSSVTITGDEEVVPSRNLSSIASQSRTDGEDSPSSNDSSSPQTSDRYLMKLPENISADPLDEFTTDDSFTSSESDTSSDPSELGLHKEEGQTESESADSESDGGSEDCASSAEIELLASNLDPRETVAKIPNVARSGSDEPTSSLDSESDSSSPSHHGNDNNKPPLLAQLTRGLRYSRDRKSVSPGIESDSNRASIPETTSSTSSSSSLATQNLPRKVPKAQRIISKPSTTLLKARLDGFMVQVRANHQEMMKEEENQQQPKKDEEIPLLHSKWPTEEEWIILERATKRMAERARIRAGKNKGDAVELLSRSEKEGTGGDEKTQRNRVIADYLEREDREECTRGVSALPPTRGQENKGSDGGEETVLAVADVRIGSGQDIDSEELSSLLPPSAGNKTVKIQVVD